MNWIRRIGVMCAVVVLGAMVASSPASASPGPAQGYYWINNNNVITNCLLMQVGTHATLYPCSNYADQEWLVSTLPGQPDDTYTMKNLASGKCLGVPSKAKNAVVGEQTCNYNGDATGAMDQWVWEIIQTPAGNGWRVRNLWSGLCLLGQNGATNVTVTQYSCALYGDQQWEVSLQP